MAKTRFTDRMKRLFDNNMIVRDIGGGRRKVVDIKQVQETGLYDQNQIIGKYNRVFQSGGQFYNNSMIGYQQLYRTQLYQDYDLMDKEAICSSALDIISSVASLKDDQGDILRITTNDEDIKSILENLFYDILNIENNLSGWIRSLCKNGDFPLFLQFMDKHGIIYAMPLDVYGFSREEELTESGFKTKFYFEAGGISASTSGMKKELDNYEVAHFRLIKDQNYLPYGKSILENARNTWKSYVMLKDASLIHRITRSADKRTYFWNIGGIPPNEVEQFMQEQIAKLKKEPYLDPSTGQYNPRYNLMSMLEDFHIPVRNGDATTKIDTTPGLNFTGMEDVEFMQGELFAALKVPKMYFSYFDSIGKVAGSQADITFSHLIEDIQKSVESELTNIALKHLIALGYTDNNLPSFELSLKSPSTVYEQEKISLLKEKMDLASSMLESNIFDSDHIYENIFNISEDEYNEMRDLVIEDKKRMFRLAQIENEGNDPVVTGKSYGTPHDLATAYNNKIHVDQTGEDAIQPENPMGRPSEHASDYDTRANSMGEDPTSKKEIQKPTTVASNRVTFKGGSPMALYENFKKVNIYDKHKNMKQRLSELNMFKIQ